MQLAKMSVDPIFAELTADVVRIILFNDLRSALAELRSYTRLRLRVQTE